MARLSTLERESETRLQATNLQPGAKICARTHALLYIVISNVIPSCHIVNRQQSDRDHVTHFKCNSFSFQLSNMGMLLSKSMAQP